MEALRVSGLISGLDTDSIVEAYVTSAKAPIVKMNQEIDELNFEKTTYNNFISMITDVKNSMLSLKMESTFKSKTTTSSLSNIATATSSINTPPGTYTLKVEQIAEPSYAKSIYTNKVLSKTGAGVTSFSQYSLAYDQLEGTHNIKVYKDSNYGIDDKWFATDTFTGNNNDKYRVNHADKTDKSLVDSNGDLLSNIKGEYLFIYEHNGEQKSIKIDMDYKAGDSLNKIASDLDEKINKQLDTIHGNNGEQSIKVTINLDDKGFNFSFYDVDTQNNIEVLGFMNNNHNVISQDIKQQIMVTKATGGANPHQVDIAVDLDFEAGVNADDIAEEIKNQISAAVGYDDITVDVNYNEVTASYEFNITGSDIDTFSTVIIPDSVKNLGFQATYKSQETKEITNVIIADSTENLAKKINSKDQGGYFIPGKVELSNGATLKEGSFKIYQDSSAVCRPETYTSFYGNTFNKIENGVEVETAIGNKETIKPTADEIEKWLNTKIGDTVEIERDGETFPMTFFDDSIDFANLNGEFYINNVKIEIEDYSTLTPNELMGKVNGSGAGVTMSYDYENNIFQISNNKGGALELTLGNYRDTSSFFQVFKVGYDSGATYVRGKNTGSLDTATAIAKLDPQFTYSVKSGTFTINGISIYVDIDKDSINDVINKINKSGAGVTMSYDTVTDKFSLFSQNGEKIKVGGKNDTSSFLLATGLLYHQQTEQEIGTAGKEAIFTVNGMKYTRESNEVKDIIPGMVFNMTDVGTTIFTVKVDTDRAVTALAEFTSKYNTLINALNPKEISYKDDLRKDYSEPLTDEKKANMSEDEIKKYQENYEKVTYYDLVSRSSELRALKTNLRSNLTMKINSEKSQYNFITEVGISIAGSSTQDITITKLGLLFDTSTDVSKLEEYIKENSKFVSILSENPDDVYYFFADATTVFEKDDDGKETSKVVDVGWARLYSNFLDTNINSSSALYKKTSTNGTIESEISSIKTQIEAQTTRVEMYLERLYSQFTAMEERLSTLQQSASYLANLSTNNSASK